MLSLARDTEEETVTLANSREDWQTGTWEGRLAYCHFHTKKGLLISEVTSRLIIIVHIHNVISHFNSMALMLMCFVTSEVKTLLMC